MWHQDTTHSKPLGIELIKSQFTVYKVCSTAKISGQLSFGFGLWAQLRFGHSTFFELKSGRPFRRVLLGCRHNIKQMFTGRTGHRAKVGES